MIDASGNTKTIKERFDEAINKLETRKGFAFGICDSGKEITTTELKEGDVNNCPPGMDNIGSFKVHPVIKDAIPSPADIHKP